MIGGGATRGGGGGGGAGDQSPYRPTTGYYFNTPSTRKGHSPVDANKKLINLSKMVFEHIQRYPETSGNTITEELQQYFRDQGQDADFKNIQRRVYDALNVMQALGLVLKERNRIQYIQNRMYQGKERRQKQKEQDQKKARHKKQAQLILREKELEVIKKRTDILQYKLGILKQTARLNVEREAHKLAAPPFIAVSSTHKPDLMINEEGSRLALHYPKNTRVHLEPDLTVFDRIITRHEMKRMELEDSSSDESFDFEYPDLLLSASNFRFPGMKTFQINHRKKKTKGYDRKLIPFSPDYMMHHYNAKQKGSPSLSKIEEEDKLKHYEREIKEKKIEEEDQNLLQSLFGQREIKRKGKIEKISQWVVKRVKKSRYQVQDEDEQFDNLTGLTPAHAFISSPQMTPLLVESPSLKQRLQSTPLMLTGKSIKNQTGRKKDSFHKTAAKERLFQ